MHPFLDMFSIGVEFAYLAFFAAALWAEYRVKTLAALRRACQRYWTAAALAAFVLVLALASVPYDGWWSVAIQAVTFACCVGCAIFTDRKRDRRVLEEMQRDLGRDL